MAASDYARPGASVSEESAHGMWERSLDSSEKEAIGYIWRMVRTFFPKGIDNLNPSNALF